MINGRKFLRFEQSDMIKVAKERITFFFISLKEKRIYSLYRISGIATQKKNDSEKKSNKSVFIILYANRFKFFLHLDHVLRKLENDCFLDKGIALSTEMIYLVNISILFFVVGITMKAHTHKRERFHFNAGILYHVHT